MSTPHDLAPATGTLKTGHRRIWITETGPRDGLQNQPALIPAEVKVRFINTLVHSGVPEVEVSSFVSPRWVPQLADADEVFAAIDRPQGVVLSALVPNERGLDRALAARVAKVSVFTAASEEFSRHNTNATIRETIARFRPVVERARDSNLTVRAYISCVVRCPYAGPIEPAAVADVARMLLDLGVDELSLGETIGVAVPTDVERLYEGLDGVIEPSATAFHMHDTRGTGLACVVTANRLGVHTFDSSAGGIGGCPYAPGAMGNVATEDVVYCFERMGLSTGVDLDELVAAGRGIEKALGRPLPGRMYRARRSQCADENS